MVNRKAQKTVYQDFLSLSLTHRQTHTHTHTHTYKTTISTTQREITLALPLSVFLTLWLPHKPEAPGLNSLQPYRHIGTCTHTHTHTQIPARLHSTQRSRPSPQNASALPPHSKHTAY